jgi:CheY-like chemotaxis protein
MSARRNPTRRSESHRIRGGTGEPGHPERVFWLGCGGHTTSALLGHCASSLDQMEVIGSLVVVLENLERLEDSVTGLLLGLHSIAHDFKTELTVVDPSGFYVSVAPVLAGNGSIPCGRSVPLSRGFRRLLFVEQVDSGMELLRKVLDLFGYQTQVVQTAGEARGALSQAPRDAIVLDLDLPCAQALGVAEFARDHGNDASLLGVTSMEDVWNHDVAVRYGFHKILGRPFLLREALDALGTAVARR